VRGVWQRQGLTPRNQRLLWLEQVTAADGGVLTEAHLRQLGVHRRRATDPDQYLGSAKPGFLLCQDREDLQPTVAEAHSSLAFAKLHNFEGPDDCGRRTQRPRVARSTRSTFEIAHALTDNGRETFGKPHRTPPSCS
jgi:hypothetical protein